ncbi:MAG TPA: hypothetical protein VGD81_10250 [Opitutaceae bacterium]
MSGRDGSPTVSGRMCMRTIMTIVSVWLMAGMSLAEGVRLGMTRAQVEAELGAPASTMQRGDRTILMYAGKGRVELIGGQVVEAAFVPIDDSPAPPALLAPPPAPPVAADAAASTAATGVAVLAASAAPEPEKHAKEPAPRSAGEAHARPDGVEMVSTETAESAPASFWSAFALGALVRLLITVVVLKAAFRWVDVHADWGQMFVPALADTLTRGLIGAIAYARWQTDQLFYLDEGVAYFVLLGVLMKTTHATTWQRAVAVSAAAKVASLVVWSFASVFVTRWAFR